MCSYGDLACILEAEVIRCTSGGWHHLRLRLVFEGFCLCLEERQLKWRGGALWGAALASVNQEVLSRSRVPYQCMGRCYKDGSKPSRRSGQAYGMS